jgi:hypothetical protein
MGTEQERLERDIMRQRMQLGDNVDALVEKVSPTQAAKRSVGRVAEKATSVKDRIMGHDSDPAPDTAYSAGNWDTDPVYASAYPDSGPSTKEALADKAGDAKDSLVSAKDSAVDSVGSAAESTKVRAQGNPLAAGLIAFGVGWLAASLIPASKTEQRAGTALRERAEEPVKAAGQQLGEKAKELAGHLEQPAKEAAGRVQQSATEGVQEVKDTAAGHADNLADEAKDRAGTVQDTAK